MTQVKAEVDAANAFCTAAAEEFASGGPDREEECVAVLEAEGVDPSGLRESFAIIRELRRGWELEKPKLRVVEPAQPQKASLFLPETQPSVEETKATPKVERRDLPSGKGQPMVSGPVPDELCVLNPQAPMDTAKEFTQRYCRVEGRTSVWFWQGQFWRWNGRFYAQLGDEEVRGQVYDFLDAAKKMGNGQSVRFLPTPRHVNEVLDCLKSALGLGVECQPPMWLKARKPAPEMVAFANVLVNVLTGEAKPLGPDLWVHSALEFDWQPKAKCPVWDKFLRDVFESDSESKEFLEQWMGYCMTEETRLQKGVLLIGPKRSGKGTISHVMRRLVGDQNYVGLSFSTWVTSENSKECLIGKRVAVFPDVRFKPGRQYGASYDPGGISHISAEFLLNIIGEDAVTIGRKYKSPWHGQLRLKVMLISNEVPNLNDVSGVLPSRFIKLKFTKSFFDCEDPWLRSKLEAELPGIAARCVAAYGRLGNGLFTQPASGKSLEREVIAASDPWIAMFDDCFVAEPGGMVVKTAAYTAFSSWCLEHGRKDMSISTTNAKLTTRLRALLPSLGEYREHGKGRKYVGLTLRKKDE